MPRDDRTAPHEGVCILREISKFQAEGMLAFSKNERAGVERGREFLRDREVGESLSER